MKEDLQRRRRAAFWSAFWAAISAPGLALADRPSITRIDLPDTSPMDAMRSDWKRIGDDFSRVIAREENALKKQH